MGSGSKLNLGGPSIFTENKKKLLAELYYYFKNGLWISSGGTHHRHFICIDKTKVVKILQRNQFEKRGLAFRVTAADNLTIILCGCHEIWEP